MPFLAERNTAMLTTLLIKNLAVIREIEVSFEKGLTVLTGETGAGKSILMDALQMILGARASKDMIRDGEKSALVEAAFYFPEEESVPEKLSSCLIDNSLILSREIFRDGRNVVKINGSLSNTAMLRELAPYLISIHSQHDNQILFEKELHYRFLDSYAENEAAFLKYQACYREYQAILSELSELEVKSEQDNSRVDYLKFVISDIENAHLLPDEEDTLREVKAAFKNKEKNEKNIKSATYAWYENQESAYYYVSVALQAVSQMDGMEELADRLENMKHEIYEISETVRGQGQETESPYRNIDEVEDRLGEIYRLKQKYGGTFQGVLTYLEQAKDELYSIENRESFVEELAKKKAAIQKELTVLAEELSNRRRRAAKELGAAIKNELQELMMPNASFLVRLNQTEDFRSYGCEQVEFLFSANLGIEAAPLCKIASGGEISRVNLALKSVLRGIDPACAFVFDEIDTGLSGRAAQKTGEKMYHISKGAQVLCVTHLPQIAAMADNHILVSKEETKEETVTTVSAISESERANELARMIGGVSVTELTYQNAREILDLAKQLKQEC